MSALIASCLLPYTESEPQYFRQVPVLIQSGVQNQEISDILKSLAHKYLRGKVPGEFEMIMTLLETGCDADCMIAEGQLSWL